jgi:hypothetical protein
MQQTPPERAPASPEARADAVPATLTLPLLQYLSTLAPPASPPLDAPTAATLAPTFLPPGDGALPPSGALRNLVDQLLQDPAVQDALQRALHTVQQDAPNAMQTPGSLSTMRLLQSARPDPPTLDTPEPAHFQAKQQCTPVTTAREMSG